MINLGTHSQVKPPKRRGTSPLASGSNPAHQFGRVVALLMLLGSFAAGGGGGRYLSAGHGIGQSLTVLDSFSSSVSSVSLPTQHLVLIAIPILL
jgi:hypothetical protein